MKSDNLPIWYKGVYLNEAVERFTVGNDNLMDEHIMQFDVMGTIAHVRMLQSVGLLTNEELAALERELRVMFRRMQNNDFVIEKGVEDVHSQVELILTRRLGDTGKKVHSGRSRNDQVLVDVRMFIRQKIEELVKTVGRLFD